MKLALPDLVSNSYFPAIAAIELGYFRDEGLDVSLELIFPVPATFAALRDGRIDFVAGSSHAPLAAFPRFEGARLLCALSQGMYWFLVVRADLPVERGDMTGLKGLRIGAAPGVDLGLRRMIAAAGIDAESEGISIGPLPRGVPEGASFGVAAAEALVKGEIDAFWANGMGAEVAVESGIAKIIIDVRRGDGPVAAFGFTQPALVTTEALIARKPDAAAGAVRAIARVHREMKRDPALATQVGEKLFPTKEAGLIRRLIERDLPYYDTAISADFVASMTAFSRDVGLLDTELGYEQVVATQFGDLWRS